MACSCRRQAPSSFPARPVRGLAAARSLVHAAARLLAFAPLCALSTFACNADPLGSLVDELDCVRGCNLPNATTICSDNGCEIYACATGFGDCNGESEDGCETSLVANPTHCGACDNACAECAEGSCRTVVTVAQRSAQGSGKTFVTDLAIDATQVYWLEGFPFDGAPMPLFAVSKQGGEPRLVNDERVGLTSLAADASALYAVELVVRLEQDVYSTEAHRLLRITKDTGQSVELANAQGEPTAALVLDAAHLYWGQTLRDLTGERGVIPGGGVLRVSKDGGPIETLTSWEQPGGPLALAVDETWLYWSGITFFEGTFDAALVRWSLVDRTPEVLHNEVVERLIADTDALFTMVTSYNGGRLSTSVKRLPLAGGEPRELWTSRAATHSFVSDARFIYVADWNSVTQIDKQSGEAKLVVGAQLALRGLAADGDFVYFAMADAIRKVAVE
jgi:hypothetical protein